MEKTRDFEQALLLIKDTGHMRRFLQELLTPDELRNVLLRWRLMQLLHEGQSQRAISRQLNISLCKITRGAKVLKNKSSVTGSILSQP